LPGAERLYGYSPDEMKGRSLFDIVPEEEVERMREINREVRQGRSPQAFETQRRRADGTLVAVSVRCSPIYGPEGAVVEVSSSDRDIEHQKITERQLIEADEQKDRFLATLGHELRNPLAAIRSATQLLMLDDGGVYRESALAVLDRQTRHLGRLLDGLLDLSRIVRDVFELDLEVVDLTQLCREVLSDLSLRSDDMGPTVDADIPSYAVWLEGDRVRLVQMLDNLLSNATKFTPKSGRVHLRLERQGDLATLTVEDTGVGIEATVLPSVFETFRQSPVLQDHPATGFGLGLALVKAIVDLHGGTVTAHSEGRDQGATFEIRLPTTKKRRSRRPEPADAKPLRILLIEDSLDGAEVTSLLLTELGHEVELATTADEGIERATTKKPDVVLCDLGLPGAKSGLDVAAALRADPDTEDLLLVAVTGFGRPEDRKRSSDAGFDEHLTKPVDMDVLRRLLGSARTGGSDEGE